MCRASSSIASCWFWESRSEGCVAGAKGKSSSTSASGLLNRILVRCRRPAMSSRRITISPFTPNQLSREGLLVQITSPSLPFAFPAPHTSRFASATTRRIRLVKICGTDFRGMGVAAPAENALGQASLSPGTKMSVVCAMSC